MEQFSLRWNNYLNQVTDAFGSLRSEEDLVDVTLSCEGKKLKAHKILLSACSSYFREIFKENPCQHPVIVFRNVKYIDLEAIIDFMYKGEVNVVKDQLDSFLGTAELLEVKGLTDGTGAGKDDFHEEDDSLLSQSNLPCTNNPPTKKRKYQTTSTPPVKTNERKQQQPTLVDTPSLPLPKIEKEEYVEDLTFDEDEEIGMSHPASPDIVQASLRNSKTDNSLDFPNNLSEDQQNHGLLDMGQILAEPGTSLEAVSQESMQVEEIGDPEVKVRIDDTDEKSKLLQEIKRGECQKLNLTIPATISQFVDEKQSTLSKKDPEEGRTDRTENIIDHKKQSIQSSPLNNRTTQSVIDQRTMRLPHDLTVSLINNIKTQAQDPMVLDSETDDNNGMRSEEAKTPIQEEKYNYQIHQQSEELHTTADFEQIENEPELAEEAPEVVTDLDGTEVLEEEEKEMEEEKEPEFDYYGCELCKHEAKPVVDRFVFNHKCPICPCMCFCAHLLKEHMRIIHGWFNVQRRFKQY